jgi:hypothetical protein
MIMMVVEWWWGVSVLCFIVVLVVEMVMFGWVIGILDDKKKITYLKFLGSI